MDFTAPEMLVPDVSGVLQPFEPKADVWSLGLVFYYCAFGATLPYEQLENIDVLHQEICAFQELKFPCPPCNRVPTRFREIIALCLQRDPKARPSSSDVVALLEKLENRFPLIRNRAGPPTVQVGAAVAEDQESLSNAMHTAKNGRPELRLQSGKCNNDLAIILLASPIVKILLLYPSNAFSIYLWTGISIAVLDMNSFNLPVLRASRNGQNYSTSLFLSVACNILAHVLGILMIRLSIWLISESSASKAS
jgi:serine/threonine protein kinase